MAEEQPQTLGAKIRALRIAKGLTQGELAQGEITPGLISQIESDRVAPSSRVATMIAKLLGVEAEALLVDVETRGAQNQRLREIRERLHAGDGAQAEALLRQLQETEILYLSPRELRLEMAFARELQGFGAEAAEVYAQVELEAFLANEHLIAANCMNRQGDYYDRLGLLSRAFFCYRQALNHLLHMGNPPTSLLIYANRNLAICAYRMGDSAVATPYADDAYRLLADSSQHHDFAEVCHFMSVLLMDLGKKKQALALASQAVRLYHVLGRSEALTDAKMNQAIVQRSLGDHKAALRALPALITEYYEQGRHTRLTNAWTERALCEIARGLKDDAARSLERSFSLALPDTPEYAEALRVRGQLQWASGKRDQAIKTYEDAFAILTGCELISESKDVLDILSDLYSQVSNIDGMRHCVLRKNRLETQRTHKLRTLRISAAISS